jgi:hypothetical protein
VPEMVRLLDDIVTIPRLDYNQSNRDG